MESPSEVLQKNVYLIWNNSILGDLINGTITTFKICKLYNYNLIIDMSNSNISHFLRNGKTPLCISPYINFQTNAYQSICIYTTFVIQIPPNNAFDCNSKNTGIFFEYFLGLCFDNTSFSFVTIAMIAFL